MTGLITLHAAHRGMALTFSQAAQQQRVIQARTNAATTFTGLNYTTVKQLSYEMFTGFTTVGV